jgi:RNA-splicing ligase RtcB
MHADCSAGSLRSRCGPGGAPPYPGGVPVRQLVTDADDRPLVRSYASEVDEGTLEQAMRSARLPVMAGPIALMPDAHVGIGATVGSVLPTRDAVIPAAVGVDLGCGMIAVETDLDAAHLPDDLDRFMPRVERAVPAGLGRWHDSASGAAEEWLRTHPPASELDTKQTRKTLVQFGTLGSGNHFFEVCLDERDRVWVVLHSGSRGIGNELATRHIEGARRLARDLELSLADPDLAWFTQGTPAFERYIGDMLWAQDYALANREQMMHAALAELFRFLGTGREVDRINCHHNFTEREVHDGREVWITRKGAIKADRGDRGVIPGSMGARSYVVRGRGNPLSYRSCAHGAGRRYSRSKAKRTFTVEDMATAMEGRVWQAGQAAALLDEIPGAYKDIDQVMADQADLVEVVHTLRQVFNYKGTEPDRRSRRRR